MFVGRLFRILSLVLSTLHVAGCQPSPPVESAVPNLTPLVLYASFEPDSKVPRPSTRPILALAASEILAGRPVCIQVLGAQDRSQPDAYRDAMSIRRATVVHQELMARGVSHWIVTIRGAEVECLCPTVTERNPYPPEDRIVQIAIGAQTCG